MISTESLALFVLACIALAATPGPNVALIVGTSLKHGRRAGILTATGVNVGLIAQLALVAGGLAYVVDAFSRHFDLVRYAGAAYLVWLAVMQWRGAGVGIEAPMPSAIAGEANREIAEAHAARRAIPKSFIRFLPRNQ